MTKLFQILKLILEYWDKILYTGLLIAFVWMLITKAVDPTGFGVLCGTLLVIDRVLKKKPTPKSRTQK
jgi:hypothetical protein